MYSVAPLHPLHNAILELVARYPEISIGDLHRHLQKKHKIKTSLQHVYRTVGQMMEEQMLLKQKGKVSLNLMWLSYLADYTDRARKASTAVNVHLAGLPLEEGQKIHFDASSLLEAETIWNHVLVQLYRLTQVKTLHKYYSHAWWLLGKHARDISFYQTLATRGIRCLWLFGNDTALDRLGASRLQSVFTAVLAKKHPFPSQGYNLNVYGEYILECIFPEKMQRQMAFFFAKTSSAEEFDEEVFRDLFSQPGKFRITLWRKAAQANELRTKIDRFVA